MKESPGWVRGMSGQGAKLTASDAALIESARSGDSRAFAELWRRHYRPAARVARQYTSSIDADDLVSEAFVRIYQRVLAGGGPTGAFRPYLYTTVRNLASSWGAASRDVQVDVIEDFEDERIPDDPAAWALDRTLTARAFRSLPERWQTVLWYTEVEGMDPHEVAPIMGLTPNGVAALSDRAREALRRAWLQAHVTDATSSGDCQWTMARLGDHSRRGLGSRDTERITSHLAGCERCTIVAEEVADVGSHLALVMLPLLLGGAVGGSLLAGLAHPDAAAAAEAAVPELPPAVEAVGAAALAAPVVGGVAAGTSSGVGAMVGGAALAAIIGGSLILGAPAADPEQSPSGSVVVPVETTAVSDPSSDPSTGPESDPGPEVDVDVLAGGIDDALTGLDDTVDGILGTITGGEPPAGHTAPGGIVGADLSLDLSGTGTPGAYLSLQAAGQVYAATTIAPDGTFTLAATAIPGGLDSLELIQAVDRSFLESLIPGASLAELLGTLDGLVNALIRPVTLAALPPGVTITVVS